MNIGLAVRDPCSLTLSGVQFHLQFLHTFSSSLAVKHVGSSFEGAGWDFSE